VPVPYPPALEELGFTDVDLAAWRVDRRAAESFLRHFHGGASFEDARAAARPPITSLTFSLALVQHLQEWRAQRPPVARYG
jgi:hypothetical protein